MPLYEVVTTTTSVEQLARDTASLLEGKTKTKVPTKEGITLFELQWAEEFGNLASELSKTIVKDVQRLVAIIARAKIRKTRPDEYRTPPAVVLLETGWLSTSKNEIVILLPLQMSDDGLKEARLRLQSDVTRKDSCETKLLPGSSILVFESVRFRTVPAEIPFLMLSFPTSVELAEDGA